MQGSCAEANQWEHYTSVYSETLKNIRAQREELRNKLEEATKESQEETIKESQEENEKEQQEWDAETEHFNRMKEEIEDKLRKQPIKRVYIGDEVSCKFLRTINIKIWFAIKDCNSERINRVYVGTEVPFKFLRNRLLHVSR